MTVLPPKPPTLVAPLLFLLAVTLLALLAWYAGTRISIEQVALQEIRLRSHIVAAPWHSFALGLAVYTALSLVPGTGGKAMVYGWLFGFWRALVLVLTGLTLAAMAIFLLSRYLLRESIESRYTRFLALMNRHLEQEGAFYLLTLRMAHAPFSIVNPVSGASRVRTWTFLWTTVAGLLPGTLVWVYAGIRMPTLDELASHGATSLIDLPLLMALAACPLLPLLFRWIISRYGIPVTDGGTRGITLPAAMKDDT